MMRLNVMRTWLAEARKSTGLKDGEDLVLRPPRATKGGKGMIVGVSVWVTRLGRGA